MGDTRTIVRAVRFPPSQLANPSPRAKWLNDLTVQCSKSGSATHPQPRYSVCSGFRSRLAALRLKKCSNFGRPIFQFDGKSVDPLARERRVGLSTCQACFTMAKKVWPPWMSGEPLAQRHGIGGNEVGADRPCHTRSSLWDGLVV